MAQPFVPALNFDDAYDKMPIAALPTGRPVFDKSFLTEFRRCRIATCFCGIAPLQEATAGQHAVPAPMHPLLSELQFIVSRFRDRPAAVVVG
jgi:hypothetical protein